MARATVNREVRYLQRGYRLLFDTHEIGYVPRVKLLEGENVREGLNRSLKPTKAQFFRDKAYLNMEAQRFDWKPRTRGNSLLTNEKFLAEREGFEPPSPDG